MVTELEHRFHQPHCLIGLETVTSLGAGDFTEKTNTDESVLSNCVSDQLRPK